MTIEYKPGQVLRAQMPWRKAFYYQKADVLYHITYVFCKRFLPEYGDRTVDQMVQAARSGKQNIVEGIEAGMTSTETQIKLLNVERASLQELREDYHDFLTSRNLSVWHSTHTRYAKMLDFCRNHNRTEDYQPYLDTWSAEEMANTALTLCHLTDTLLNGALKKMEEQFVKEGGIKERMYAARTGYRRQQDIEADEMRRRIAMQEAEIARLRALLEKNGIEWRK